MFLRPTLSTILALAASFGAAEEAAPQPHPLSLADAVKLSAAAAPVGVARLDAAIAQAGLGAQRQALLPNLSATGGVTRAASYFPQGADDAARLSPYNVFDARLRVGQALIDFDAWNRACAAQRRLAAAEAATALALEDAAANAGLAYVALASDQALVAVRRRDLVLAEDLLKLASAQVQAGTAEAIAGTRAEIRVAAARSALTAAEGATGQASIALARTLNLDPAVPLATTDPLSDALGGAGAPAEPAAASAAARRGRPELQVSIETLAQLEAERRAARGAQLPKLSGFADAGRTGPRLDDTVTTWEVGLQISVPLLDRSRFDERAADYAAQQQRILLDDLGRRIEGEVRDALVALTTGRAQLIANREQVRLAELEVAQARVRFENGVAGNLELIDAQRGLVAAEELAVAAQQTVAAAQVRLARAVGSATAIR